MYFLGLKTPPTLTLNPSCQDQNLASFRGPLASISLSEDLFNTYLYMNIFLFILVCQVCFWYALWTVHVCEMIVQSLEYWMQGKGGHFFFFFFWSGWILGISAVSEKQLHWK